MHECNYACKVGVAYSGRVIDIVNQLVVVSLSRVLLLFGVPGVLRCVQMGCVQMGYDSLVTKVGC